MKKLTVLFVLAVLLLFSVGVIAKGFEFVGGATYNNFLVKVFYDGEKIEDIYIPEDLHAGFGFYAGGRYWLNDKLGVGGGYDYATTDWNYYDEDEDEDEDYNYWEKAKVDADLTGPYAELVYRVNDVISLNGALAYYKLDIESKYEENNDGSIYKDIEKVRGKDFGYLLGVKINYPVNESVSIIGDAGYRSAKIDDSVECYDEDTNGYEDLEKCTGELRGLRVSGGISFNF